MRIHKLRLCNLHSLRGEFELDFLSPPLSDTGLFAITGDTGSGKSTLLDAITLALYGSVHRYDAKGSPTDEIMTQGTGFCWAEVEFEADGQHYLARYERRRARRHPDGRLQTPRRSLARREKGEWLPLAEKSRDVSRQIEEATGLDFKRFTRSALLAQGDFAAFLQARKDERSALLEQITGTEIYSEISKSCHERFGLEKKALEDLRQKLAMLQLPSEEEQQAVENRLRELEKEIATRGKEREHWHHKLNQWQQLQAVEQREQALKEQQAAWLQASEAFAPQAQRLRAHEGARPLEKDLQEFELLLQQKQQAEKHLRLLQQEWTALKKKLATLKPEVQKKEQEYLRLLNQQDEHNQMLTRVAGLDAERATLEKQLAVLHEQLKQYTDQLHVQTAQWKELQAANARNEQRLKQIEHYIVDKNNLLQLVDKEQIVVDQLKQYKKEREEETQLRDTLAKLSKELEALEAEWKEQEAEILRREKQLHSREEELAASLGAGFVADAWMWLKELDDRLLAGDQDREGEEALYRLRNKAVSAWKQWKQEREELLEWRLQRNPLAQKREQKLWQLRQLGENLQHVQARLHRAARAVCSSMGWQADAALQGEALEKAVHTFLNDLAAFRQMQTEQEQIRKSLQQNTLEEKHLAEALAEKQQQLQQLQAADDRLSGRVEALRKQRSALLGDQPVEEVRRQYKNLLERLRKESNELKSDLAAGTARLQALEKQGKQHKQEMSGQEKQLEERRLNLAKAAKKRGFSDIDALRAALLPEEEWKALSGREASLREQEIRLQEKARQLSQERALLEKELEGLKREEVLQAFERCQRAYEEAIETRTRLQEQRKQWKTLAGQHRHWSEEIKKRERSYARWSVLNDLIGSHDGKKFRTFAQRLTLRRLVVLANRHLNRLNKRYALRVKPDSRELELEILDSYQANRSRSVFSLSGGESFLASLALALGLSDMVGRRAKIRSLFIDEGFGSLDAHALDQALSALEQLQSSGKTIGLISHVRAMQERIPVQVVLKKLGGGISTLQIVS